MATNPHWTILEVLRRISISFTSLSMELLSESTGLKNISNKAVNISVKSFSHLYAKPLSGPDLDKKFKFMVCHPSATISPSSLTQPECAPLEPHIGYHIEY